MICRVCSNEIPDSANYCPTCGSRQSRTHCINCGHTLEPNNTYCPNCGILIYKPSQSKTEDLRKKRRRRNALTNLVLFLCFLASLALAAYLYFFPVI